jgi:protein-S-isoprenylcysteine O-methyltransferase Ste14
MELAAYLLVGVFAAVCVGGRTWLHWHRTGRLPVHLRSGRQASIAILGWGGALVAGALCASAGLSAPLVHNDALAALGVALALAGITLTMWAQLSMGESWRIGIDTDERTRLVTEGPYRSVRNPIYSAMMLFAVGLCALIPNLVSIIALTCALGAIDTFVRRVEEPHLASVHGAAFRAWASSTGRFLPKIGTVH